MKLFLPTLFIFLALTNVCSADAYDSAVNYQNEHPDWKCVTMSDHQLFKGISTIVNYKFIDGELHIHDAYTNEDYTIGDWQAYTNYHFWINESPVRYYKFLIDNSEEVL